MNFSLPIAYAELAKCQKAETNTLLTLETLTVTDAFISKESGNVAACMFLLPEDRTLSIVVQLSSTTETAVLASTTTTSVPLHSSFSRNIVVRTAAYNTMQLLLNDVKTELTTKTEWRGKYDTIRVSGYSAGGGVAHLLGLFLRVTFGNATRVHVYTYGAPMVLGKDGFTSSIVPMLNIASFRVALSEDPTAMTGPAELAHTQAHYLLPDGTIQLVPQRVPTNVSFHTSASYLARLVKIMRTEGKLDIVLEDQIATLQAQVASLLAPAP